MMLGLLCPFARGFLALLRVDHVKGTCVFDREGLDISHKRIETLPLFGSMIGEMIYRAPSRVEVDAASPTDRVGDIPAREGIVAMDGR